MNTTGPNPTTGNIWFTPANGQLPVERVAGLLPVERTPTYDQLVADLAASQPTDLPPHVVEVIRELDRPGVKVTTAQIDPQPCEWCALDGHVTTVRVYGEPLDDDPYNPLDVAETCRSCAPAALKQARAEQNPNSDNDIKVEVNE